MGYSVENEAMDKQRVMEFKRLFTEMRHGYQMMLMSAAMMDSEKHIAKAEGALKAICEVAKLIKESGLLIEENERVRREDLSGTDTIS